MNDLINNIVKEGSTGPDGIGIKHLKTLAKMGCSTSRTYTVLQSTTTGYLMFGNWPTSYRSLGLMGTSTLGRHTGRCPFYLWSRRWFFLTWHRTCRTSRHNTGSNSRSATRHQQHCRSGFRSTHSTHTHHRGGVRREWSIRHSRHTHINRQTHTDGHAAHHAGMHRRHAHSSPQTQRNATHSWDFGLTARHYPWPHTPKMLGLTLDPGSPVADTWT